MRWGTGLPLGEHPGIQLAPGQLRLLVKPPCMASHVGSTTMTWALTSVGKDSPSPDVRWSLCHRPVSPGKRGFAAPPGRVQVHLGVKCCQ